MTELTATFLRESDLEDCPMLDSTRMKEFRHIIKGTNGFSLGVKDWLGKRSPEQQAAWIKTSLQAGRELFQPWAMETLYAIAILETARFSQLEALLDVSSKTLTNKLKTLRAAGFVERRLFDETPVRIEYVLTKAGRATAALASPLFAHLNMVQLMRERDPTIQA